MSEESFERLTVLGRGIAYALFTALSAFTMAVGVRLFYAGRVDLSIPPLLLSVLSVAVMFYVNKLK